MTDLATILPNGVAVLNNKKNVKDVIRKARQENFTDVIIINEDSNKPSKIFIMYIELPVMLCGSFSCGVKIDAVIQLYVLDNHLCCIYQNFPHLEFLENSGNNYSLLIKPITV